MAFIDGENLVARYQAMIGAGRRPQGGIVHEPNEFVWSPGLNLPGFFEPVRAYYYASMIGDADKVAALETRIRAVRFCTGDLAAPAPTFLYPRVFKKPARSPKTSTVDIQLAVDALSHTYQDDLDAVIITTGDGDFLSLAKQIVSRGRRVYIAAFSDGLSSELAGVADQFLDLDRVYFHTA